MGTLPAGFAAVRDLVRAEPDLSDFLPAVDELYEQARRVAKGDLAIGSLTTPTRVGRIPSRDLARRVVEAAAQIPNIDGDEDQATKRAIARLQGNVVDAIYHAVFSEYSDLVRGEP